MRQLHRRGVDCQGVQLDAVFHWLNGFHIQRNPRHFDLGTSGFVDQRQLGYFERARHDHAMGGVGRAGGLKLQG